MGRAQGDAYTHMQFVYRVYGKLPLFLARVDVPAELAVPRHGISESAVSSESDVLLFYTHDADGRAPERPSKTEPAKRLKIYPVQSRENKLY
ncbi:hypothetical protein MRX96_019074 [Rhipicephalus microplus]